MLCADYLKGDLFMDDKKTDRKENKRRFQLWIKQSTLDSASEIYSLDNCASMSEFIEKAVLTECYHLNDEKHRLGKRYPNEPIALQARR